MRREPWFRGHGPGPAGPAREGKSPLPLPLHVPPAASASLQAPASRRSLPGPGPHSPGEPAAGAAPARRARARAPRASCCPDRLRERGRLRGSGRRRAARTARGSWPAPPGRWALHPRAMPRAQLSTARAVGPAGYSLLSTAGFLSARLRSAPARTSPAELRLIINPQALSRCKN